MNRKVEPKTPKKPARKKAAQTTDVVKQIETVKGKIQKSLDAIAKERDKLRDYVSEVNGIIDDADNAEALLNDAKRSLDDAADALSKYM